MKRLIYTSVILLIAFTVDAQSSRTRSEKTQRSEPAKKEEVKRPSRTTNSTERNTNVQPSTNNRSRSQSEVERSSSRQRPESRQVEERSTQRPEREVEKRSSYERGNEIRPRVEHSDADRNQRRVTSPRPDERENAYRPEPATRYERERRTYSANRDRRVERPAPKTYHAYKPIEYRRKHYVYRVPPRHTIVWNVHMYNEYLRLYPDFRYWYYPIGYRIHTISAYDAGRYIGEVARV
ncbi:MAG: hypothetical protein ACP5E3_02345 [Bacteroidales bacterium]